MVISFCGHSHFMKTHALETKILHFLEGTVGDKPAEFYLGGYGSFDDFAYDCSKKYQSQHPNIRLVFITPYITVEYQRNHLEHQKKRYDDIIYPEIESVPLKFAITYRNRWMMEKADYVVAYVDRSYGGAYQAYRYAKRKKKAVFNLSEKEIEN